MQNINNLFKIKIDKNKKKPTFTGWQLKVNHSKANVDTNLYNVALLAGKVNNFFVLDVDKKDEGLEEFDKYVSEFGEPQTVKQLTPSGGFHLFFKYTHTDKDAQFLIDNYLTNKAKYRDGKGLDIRTTGGIVLIEPSVIDGKKYKFVEDRTDMLEMPLSLINFVLMGAKDKKINKNIKLNENRANQEIIYKITDDEINELLLLLDDVHNNTNKWLVMTSILKSLDKFQIWDDWSKLSSKYNKENNLSIWENNKGLIDINYLIYIINKEKCLKIENISIYKKYNHITKNLKEIKKVIVEQKYIFISNEQFTNNNTIIFKSCTGTGKTTATAKAIKTYLDNNTTKQLKVLSIVSKISLGKQHIKSFNDANINLMSYQEKEILIFKI